MKEENTSQEFRLKNIHETRNYLIKEIDQNELMSNKAKMVCTTLNYIEHFLILVSVVTGCVSISAFASLLVIPMEIVSFAIGLKVSATPAGIKKYNSIIKKKKEKHDEIMFLTKTKLHSIKILIYKCFMGSYISQNEFVVVNNVIKEHDMVI